MTRTISLPFFTAKEAATAVLPHVSNDDVTPVLTHAVIRERHLLATDRYTVGDYDLAFAERPEEPASKDEKALRGYASLLDDWERRAEVRYTQNDEADDWDEQFYIPRAALARIATLNERQSTVSRDMLSYSRVTITEGTMGPAGAPTLTTTVGVHDGDVEVFRQVFVRARFTTYPPVWKLLADWKPQEEGAPTFGLMPEHLRKVFSTVPKYQPFKITAGAPSNGHKQGPMMAEVGEHFRALIQPSLILR